jgi:hypothetical protein
LGEGWDGAEDIQGASAQWAVNQDAQVFLPTAGDGGYRLTLTALPFGYPGSGTQTVTPKINGHSLDERDLAPGWNPVSWEVPASTLREGLNELRLELDYLVAPVEVLPDNGLIGGTGVRAPVAIEVNSGGPADFAYITIGDAAYDNAEDGSIHRAGYNVAVINGKSGKLLDKQGFDTTPGGGEGEEAALAEFIESVPDGRIVVVALRGDGAAELSDIAVAAFRSIGGQADPRGSEGWSHAIIGVKGAATGTALEAAGPDTGWLRAAPDRRTLGMAVDTLLWEQVPAE